MPGDPQIVDLAMQQFGKAEPDWTAFDKHVRRIHEPLIDSNIYAVIYDAQSRALIERKPYLRFYEQASKLLNQRHVRLGVESPAHPDKRFDPLRKLTTVSGSVYSVWLTNRDNAQTYPAHHVPFVFIETNANSEDTSGGGPVTDADVIRERAIEVAAWANEQDRDVRIVADWFYWLGQSGFKTLDEWFTESLQ